jgi:hypothetical protein
MNLIKKASISLYCLLGIFYSWSLIVYGHSMCYGQNMCCISISPMIDQINMNISRFITSISTILLILMWFASLFLAIAQTSSSILPLLLQLSLTAILFYVDDNESVGQVVFKSIGGICLAIPPLYEVVQSENRRKFMVVFLFALFFFFLWTHFNGYFSWYPFLNKYI